MDEKRELDYSHMKKFSKMDIITFIVVAFGMAYAFWQLFLR